MRIFRKRFFPNQEDLVQLSTVPRDRWIGRYVWHPMFQLGNTPYWRECDAPTILQDPDNTGFFSYEYDFGVILEFEETNMTMDGHVICNVTFLVVDDGCELGGEEGGLYTLHYSDTNLWVENTNNLSKERGL